MFVGYLPLETLGVAVPRRCVVLLENVPADVDGQLPDYADKYIQIWNRAGDFWEARADAYALYELLHGATGITLPPVDSGEPVRLALVVDARGQPAPIAQPDSRGDFIFSANYVFRIESP